MDSSIEQQIKLMITRCVDGDTEASVAEQIRKLVAGRFNGTWHCVVGRSFGAAVAHDTDNYICVDAEGINVVVFRA